MKRGDVYYAAGYSEQPYLIIDTAASDGLIIVLHAGVIEPWALQLTKNDQFIQSAEAGDREQ